MRLAILLTFLFVACAGPAPQPTPITSPPSQCQDMSHVYSPDRLQILASCVTLTGTVEFVRHEADGDTHVGLKPDGTDPNGGNWVNSCNATCLNGAEHGYLVVEEVCEFSVTQTDAVAACVGYVNPSPVPTVGEHVSVTGPWVLDKDHGWQEIHPATIVSS